jgi:hypothetical protein
MNSNLEVPARLSPPTGIDSVTKRYMQIGIPLHVEIVRTLETAWIAIGGADNGSGVLMPARFLKESFGAYG